MADLQAVGLVVGDEIGQIKKINLLKGEITAFNLTSNEPLHFSRGIKSISPLSINGQNTTFLVSNGSKALCIYDSITDEIRQIDHSLENLDSPLVSSQCIDDQNIAMGFKKGTIYKINIEKELCSAKYKPNTKALNILGLDESAASVSDEEIAVKPPKRVKTSQQMVRPSRKANCAEKNTNEVVKLFDPGWNGDTVHLTCFSINRNRLAVGGFNAQLKIYDINTGQNIFTPKGKADNWFLPNREIWVSGIQWLDQANNDTNKDCTNLLATCSRTNPYVRIFDIRQRRSIMEVDLTAYNNANNESNMPSLTSICAAPSVTNFNGSSIIIGTTLGRMLAIDLRMQNNTSKILGGFKEFSGGSIRDIRCVRDSKTSLKVFSCSLDRFVRVHQLTKTSRMLERKFYIKTKPTCLQPILAHFNSNTSDKGSESNDDDADDYADAEDDVDNEEDDEEADDDDAEFY